MSPARARSVCAAASTTDDARRDGRSDEPSRLLPRRLPAAGDGARISALSRTASVSHLRETRLRARRTRRGLPRRAGGRMTSQIQILRYMWAGLYLTDKAVVTPNGTIVQAVRYKTLMELQQRGWITREASVGRY